MMTRMIAGTENWLYVYTADDERIWQFRMSAESATHRYTLRDLGGQVLREYSVSGDFWTIESDYVYGGRQLLAAETPGGQRHFHLDHLGTPRLITGSNGGRVAYHVYFPFGEEATDPFQDQERMKFTGHERDLADPGGTGDDLDYMHARFCSPLTGRFMSVDPAGGDPGAPQSWNRYSYGLNNPIRYTDPTGEITAAGIADRIQDAIADAKEAVTNAVSDGSAGGVLLATVAGTGFDLVSTFFDPLRAGEAIGDAIGSSTGADEIALAVTTDGLRVASIAAPAARVTKTSRAARREAMRREGIPTSQQPVAQSSPLCVNVGETLRSPEFREEGDGGYRHECTGTERAVETTAFGV